MHGPGGRRAHHRLAYRIDPELTRAVHLFPAHEAGHRHGAYRLADEGLFWPTPRFLMLTAITHHQFSSPIWEHEVRKLHAELAEFDVLAAKAIVDHSLA